MLRKEAMTSPKQACQVREYPITSADLPVSCPPRNERIWDAHPRVYLSLDDQGKVACPYCGTVFVLTHAPSASAS